MQKIYADIENLIHTQISHPTITKENGYSIENSNQITLGIQHTRGSKKNVKRE